MPSDSFSPDDPRLTAYALGELPPDEAAVVAAAVQRDPALQAAVAEIRALAGDLTEVLGAEPVIAPPVAPTEAVPRRSLAEEVAPRRIVRFPYFLISGLAAAGFAVLVAVYDESSPVRTSQDVARKPVPLELSFTEASAPASAEVATAATADATVASSALAGRAAETIPPVAETFALPLLEQIRAEQTQPANPAPKVEVVIGSPPSDVSAGAASRLAAVAEARALGERRSTARQAATLAGLSEASVPAASMSTFVSRLPIAPTEPMATEAYAYTPEQGFVRVGDQPVSTFSVDVDTASYANVRRFLQNGRLPPVDAVRIEELLNYFTYRYDAPVASRPEPFAAGIEAAAAPWNPAHRLVRIGLKGREFAPGARPAANLVFLLDVSGSMDAPNRLPLALEAMRLLVDRLRPDDRVAIVTYAGQAGLALPSTPAARRREILEALDALRPGGATQGSLGIQLAYDIARANFMPEGVNRVILCTDGDFNVGLTSEGELVRLAEEKAKSGVFLTALGFGMGNLKDATLEAIAQRGNGTYAYIDSAREARKVFVEQVEGTLATIAKDVKIQVEFNPAQVASYRLIGYENRALKREDFANDAVDAGEIGAGHTVTALYEVVPVPAAQPPTVRVDPLRYQPLPLNVPKLDPAVLAELLTVKVRYKDPAGTESRQIDVPFVDRGMPFAVASSDFKFAAAVAGFGQILRDSPHKGHTTFDQVLTWAEPGLQDDVAGHRAEFMDLVKRARELAGR